MKRKDRTPRAIWMAARGSQRLFSPALSCSVQLKYTLAWRQARGAKASE